MSKVSAQRFYDCYYGHELSHLEQMLPILRSATGSHEERRVIWLVGDSSLDNKFWLPDRWLQAVNGYEAALEPAIARPDVARLMNLEVLLRGMPYVVVNAAVEESTIAERAGGLIPQDQFVRDNMRQGDVVVASVGGNDIALHPSLWTIWSMGMLVTVASDAAVQAGNASGMAHFVSMFGGGVEAYLRALCSKVTPALVIPCMIYFPHEKPGDSWADRTLGLLGYNRNPEFLQHVIKKLYELGTCRIRLPHVHVAPCPLFQLLDPSLDSQDYVARVEPSEIGGLKLAKGILDIVQEEYGRTPSPISEEGEKKSWCVQS